MKISIIDNYDSFTYNLVQQCKDISKDIQVFKNDRIDYDCLNQSTHIVLSPGPGIPSEANDLINVIDRYHQSKAILGVCLGHQAIGEFFGSSLKNLDTVHHGIKSEITLEPSKLFSGISSKIDVGRYHSWVINDITRAPELTPIAYDSNKEIMALEHKTLPIYGVQFHPESVLTPLGINIIKNFLAQ